MHIISKKEAKKISGGFIKVTTLDCATTVIYMDKNGPSSMHFDGVFLYESSGWKSSGSKKYKVLTTQSADGFSAKYTLEKFY